MSATTDATGTTDAIDPGDATDVTPASSTDAGDGVGTVEQPPRTAAAPSRVPRVRIRLPKAPTQRSTPAVYVGWIAAALAVLSIWTVCFGLFISALQTRHDQRVLYSQFREQLAAQTAPLGGSIAVGNPVALLTSPELGLTDEVVVEGTDSQTLQSGPGHSRSTVLPGQPGVSVIYGRSTMFDGPFGSLVDLQPGARITVLTGQGKATFSVIGVRHAGDPFPAPVADGGSRLTLVTAEAPGWRSGWAPTRAVYVDADKVGKPFGYVSPAMATVLDAEKAMSGDTGSLYELVLWLPLVAAAFALIVWAQDRWGRWQAWIVGAPVVAACLWGASETAVRLLPNLM